ncbi:alpha/beta fold hydrolase [Herbaspirillum sp. GCM10030257]|uniref:alpha/beta fold hydrolase n=1 Tax=Herbaspirillum sp. GCM10030257 TaxID=3273393 RepID=UPI003621F327
MNELNGYLQIGHGPRKVLAMGGWFGEATDWSTMAHAFDPEEFTIVLFDYRGYGLSSHLTGEFNFEESANDAMHLVDQLGWDRFSLIGHSMGGVAIQRLMLAAAGRVEKMVAVTAVPACSARMDAQRLAMFESAVTDVEKREFIINFSTRSRLPATWIRQAARRSKERSTAEAFGSYLKQWATVDFSELVQGNTTPVKVLIGEHDPTLNADLMQGTWLSWYPNSMMETLSNSGHYPMFEVPLALSATIQEFLRQP